MQSDLLPFFRPRGVAVIGASASPNKLSYGILRNLTLYGFEGQVAPVNPKADRILGLKCFPDLTSVPDPLDLAVVVLPAPAIPAVLEECGQRGLKAVTIISGGFKEVGESGATLEQACLAIARRFCMRLIGPNCVGTLDLYSGLDTTFINGVPDRGGIGFVSQSGAVGGGVVDQIRGKKIGFSAFASLGNEADVTESDVIEYLGQDEHTRVIAVYVEMIRDGQRFIEVVRRVTPHKPVILLKAGRTSAGARAVSSHTGSLAGSHAAYQAAFIQSGVIEVDSVAELFDAAVALDFQPLPGGPRTVLLTNAGGPAALASDSLAVNGLVMADLSPETMQTLRQHLNPAAQVGNPVDMLGGAEPTEYALALRSVLADPNVDMAIPILVPQALVDPVEVARQVSLAARDSGKPVVACLMGEASVGGARQVLHENHVPMYAYPESTGKVLGVLWRTSQWRNQPDEPTAVLADIDRGEAQRSLDRVRAEKILGEASTRPLLQAYGIPLVAGGFAGSASQAADIAARVGFPVAMKIASPDVLHKSEAGGIRLNLVDAQMVEIEFSRLMDEVAARLPSARLEGVLVEAMAPRGQEVIVGIRRDPNFGPLMMFGLGGVYVELFNDVAFRVAPLKRSDALAMIHQTRAGRLLTGFRGQVEADLEAVVATILRLSQLALDFPEIDEVEINPLLVLPKGEGALSLDCRAILRDET